MKARAIPTRGSSSLFKGARLRVAQLLASALMFASAGCGGSAAPKPQAPRALEGPKVPLLSMVPGAPLQVVRVDLRAVRGSAALSAVYRAVVAPAREQSFAKRHGFSLHDAHEVVHAEYDAVPPPAGAAQVSELLLAAGGFAARDAVSRAGDTLELDRQEDAPWFRRGGLGGGLPREFVAYRSDTLAAGTGDPGPLYAVLRQERGPLDGPLGAAMARGAMAVAWPVFPTLPADSPLGLVLAGTRTLAITISGLPDGRLQVGLHAWGEFPASVAENLKTALLGVATTSFGATLGLGAIADSLRVRHGQGDVHAEAELPAAGLAHGLTILLRGEIRDLQ